MKRMSELPLRTKILLSALFLSLGVGAYSQAKIWTLEGELHDHASAHVAENLSIRHEIATQTTVAIPYIVFGAPVAKIEVYIRDDGATHGAAIQAIEYNYVKDETGWRLTDSGSCHDESCQMRGAKAFAANDSAQAIAP